MSVYIPTVWRNMQEPFINAKNLNNIENGVKTAHEEIAALDSKLQNVISGVVAINLPKATRNTLGAVKMWVVGTDGFLDAR